MSYLGTRQIDDVLTFTVTTHNATSGAAADADAVPSYRVYEDETGTAILTGSMALLDGTNTTGHYSEQLTLSAANGFEDGKSYSIYISAAVSSVTGTTVRNFQVDNDIADIEAAIGSLNDLSAAEVNTQVDAAIVTYGLDHLVSASATGADIADDSIIAQLVSSSATADWDTYDNTTDSFQALRDRGDAAWTTGGGGSITDLLNIIPLMPPAMDLANTASHRIGMRLINSLDDLPSGAEITPGTVEIFRKQPGGTTWANPTGYSGAQACSEVAGEIYFDVVTSTGNGFQAGDMLRFEFLNQKITVSANDHEITDGTNPMILESGILADTPDVNIAAINGSTTNVAAANTFFGTLNGSGQLQAGSLASAAFTSVKFADGFMTAAKFGTEFITATSFATDAVDANALAADAVAEIQSGLATSAALATVDGVVDAILVDTGTSLPALIGTPVADLATDIASVLTKATDVETDTQNIQSRLPATLSNGMIQADIQYINGVALVGDGSGSPFSV